MDDKDYVNLDLDFLMQSCYWIVSKFKEDDFHQQQSSSKSDLIGGFFDRWINKTHELIIFDKLLKDKEYSVVNDYFFYGQDTKKDAPDVIGLKDKKGNIYPFAYFDNGSWELEHGCPHIEVKTFKSNHVLVTIPDRQYDDDHYYVLMNSHIRPDYLLSLFDDIFFNEKYFENIIINSDNVFIKRDDENKIIKPLKLEKNTNIGKYELLGVFKGEDIKKFSRCVKEEEPFYLFDVDKLKSWNSTGAVEPFFLITGFYTFNENDGECYINQINLDNLNGSKDNGVPFYMELIGNSKVSVRKILKTAVDIEVDGKILINGNPIENGRFRIIFKKFNRSSGMKEYVSSKDTLQYCASNSQDELIECFDDIFDRIMNI